MNSDFSVCSIERRKSAQILRALFYVWEDIRVEIVIFDYCTFSCDQSSLVAQTHEGYLSLESLHSSSSLSTTFSIYIRRVWSRRFVAFYFRQAYMPDNLYFIIFPTGFVWFMWYGFSYVLDYSSSGRRESTSWYYTHLMIKRYFFLLVETLKTICVVTMTTIYYSHKRDWYLHIALHNLDR